MSEEIITRLGKVLKPIAENIPEALREGKYFLVWRLETPKGRSGKPTKPPYNAATGALASPTNPEDWTSFEEAWRAYEVGGYHGIGRALTAQDAFFAFDLDNCRDAETGTIEPWASAIVEALNTYTEVSPSGTGLRVIGTVQDKTGFPSGREKRENENVEFYTDKRYLTLTGRLVDDNHHEIRDCSDKLRALLDRIWGPQGEKENPPAAVADIPPPPEVPGEGEVKALVRVATQLVPEAERYLTGHWPHVRTEGIDRSGGEFHLARMLVERAGFRDPWTLAAVVFGSTVHQAKAQNRGELASWKLAWTCAHNALELEPPQPAAVSTPNLEFPQDAVTGLCADIAQMFSSRLEAPAPFWAISALTCLGAAISGSVTIETSLAPDPRLYSVILGQSAAPRKSTAIGKTAEFFAEALADIDTALHVEYGLGSGEGLAETLQRADGEPARCLLLLDELRLLVQKARVEHSTLLPMLCTLFERHTFSNTTRKSRIRITNAHISLLGACTTETFSAMWTPEFLDMGFMNRLFLVPGVPEREIPLPEEIPQGEKNRLAERLRSLVRKVRGGGFSLEVGGQSFPIQSAPRRLHLTSEAKNAWSAWYTDRPRSIHALRLEDYGLRLMILLEVSRGNLQTVEADTVERVTRLLAWQLAVRRAFDPLDAENKIALLEQSIKRALYRHGPTVPDGRLRKAVHAERYGERLYRWAAENLEKAGIIVITRRADKFIRHTLTQEGRNDIENAS